MFKLRLPPPCPGSGGGGGGGIAAALTPSRPCRRTFLILVGWTCVCFAAFRLGGLEGGGGGTVPVGFPPSSAGGLNTRELLENVAETRGPRPSYDEVPFEDEFLDPLEVEPAIDRSPQKGEGDVVRELAGQLPNLPLIYLHENKARDWRLRNSPAAASASDSSNSNSDNKTSPATTCARFPHLYDLHISNLYWQETETSNGTFYLYGAYMDRRKQNRLGPTVRILGMINRIEPKVKTFCQIWFSGQAEPVISKVLEYKYIWYRKWGNYKQGIFQPYLLACQLPQSHWKQVPVSVSVVEHVCDVATNNLRVTYNVPKKGEPKKDFAVCVKGLDFPADDMSVRIAEWLEVLAALGADKVFLYDLGVHPNVTKVLRHYVRQGKVDLTPLTLPGYMPNMRGLQHLYLKNMLNYKRQNEVVPYNDCLYRNMYRYKYLALLDIDEVIVPKNASGWAQMMEEEVIPASLRVKNISRSSYNFRNVYFMDEMLEANRGEEAPGGGFFPDIPQYLHMLQHVYRSANYTKPGQYVKCFHDPERVLILHNHFPLGCLGGACTSYPVDPSVGHLQHYRADCVRTLKKSCEDTYKNVSVLDTAIWRHKEQVIKRTTASLKTLGFFRHRQQPQAAASLKSRPGSPSGQGPAPAGASSGEAAPAAAQSGGNSSSSPPPPSQVTSSSSPPPPPPRNNKETLRKVP